jgi:hypothetical protein
MSAKRPSSASTAIFLASAQGTSNRLAQHDASNEKSVAGI